MIYLVKNIAYNLANRNANFAKTGMANSTSLNYDFHLFMKEENEGYSLL